MTMEPDPRCPGPDCPSISLKEDLVDSGYWQELCYEIDLALLSEDPQDTMNYYATMYDSQSVYTSLDSEIGHIVL